MKKSFFIAIATVVCAACAKEVQPQSAAVSQFTATIVNESRTAIQSDGKVFWKNGDAISVNGARYVTASDDVETATFTAVSAEAQPVDGKYYAYYPEQIYSADKLVLPETQTGSLKGSAAPMYAVSTTTDFYFTNLCGVVRLNVVKEGAKVKKIVVEANEAICGPFTIVNGGAVLASEGTAKRISVFSGAGVPISTATDFFVYLPAGTYTGLKFTFVDGSNNECVKTAKNAVTISRNSIKPIVFETPLSFVTPTKGVAAIIPCNGRTECEWVQFWADGPKFACYNVGSNGTKYQDADNIDALGEQYYAWGGSVNKDLTSYDSGTTKLGGERDTATKLWGTNWRMMDQDDLKALKENCTLTKYAKGAEGSPYPQIAVIVARGKNEYEDNMLIFPQVGNWSGTEVKNKGTNALFWLANTQTSGQKAARVMWNSGTFSFNAVEKNSVGVSVRAIYEPTDDNPTRGTAPTLSCNGRTQCEWIQLWENGPKFACYNVGSNGTTYSAATSITDLGEQYYAWGGNVNKDLTSYDSETSKLSGERDTATKLWGANWRMMDQDDLKVLKANCTFTKYAKGAAGSPYPSIPVIVARGINEYEDNFLVFPQAGSWNGESMSAYDNARFWLANQSSGKGSRVQWSSGAFTFNNIEKNSVAVSVRAVLVEGVADISTTVSGGVNFTQNSTSGSNGWL